MVSLMPMNAEVEPYSTIQFTCNYDYPDTYYVYFKLSSLNGLPVVAWTGTPGPMIKTEKGATRSWSVHVGHTACNVECHIVTHRGKELVKIVTSITPGLTRAAQRELSISLVRPAVVRGLEGEHCDSSLRNCVCVVIVERRSSLPETR